MTEATALPPEPNVQPQPTSIWRIDMVSSLRNSTSSVFDQVNPIVDVKEKTFLPSSGTGSFCMTCYSKRDSVTGCIATASTKLVTLSNLVWWSTSLKNRKHFLNEKSISRKAPKIKSSPEIKKSLVKLLRINIGTGSHKRQGHYVEQALAKKTLLPFCPRRL